MSILQFPDSQTEPDLGQTAPTSEGCRVKELIALHQVAQLLRSWPGDLAGLLEQVAKRLASALRFVANTEARVRFGDIQYATAGFRLTPWLNKTTFVTRNGTAGEIEVAYIEPRPPWTEGSFLAQESDLIDTIGDMLRMHLDHLQTEREIAIREEQFRSLAANLPGAIYRCAMDEKWTMSYLSDGVELVTGYPASDFINNATRSFVDLIPPEQNESNRREVSRALAQRRPFHLEYQLRHADGTWRWVSEIGRPLRDANGRTMIDGVILDVTQQKRAEDAEQERQHLASAVNAMRNVLGVVGHELRTPLAGLRAMSEYMLADGARETVEFNEFLRGIHHEAVRMGQLVNDMLEAARLESGVAAWHWDPVNVTAACREALEAVRPLLDGSKVALTFDAEDEHLAMNGDADSIRRLVLNLLSNAQKHTAAGYIRLRARSMRDETGRWIEIRVCDSGSGIASELRDRLGTAFALNSGSIGVNFIQGAGLGLAICRGIVTAHGGHISLASTLGKGTTFTLRLRADLDGPVTSAPEVIIQQEAAA